MVHHHRPPHGGLPASRRTVLSTIQKLIRSQSGGGLLLLLATMLALIAANGPFAELYHHTLETSLGLHLGEYRLDMPALEWVNDALMVVFFYQIGLELKRELCEGELADVRRALLPIIAAAGGMMVPALIYAVIVSQGDPAALKGWATPTATDIAFTLGVLSLLGKRVPLGLKVFLVSLAIIDDLGAILIIALFYSHGLNPEMLLLASGLLVVFLILNRRRVCNWIPHLLLSTVLWFVVLKSGIHATIAGVLAAFFMPVRDRDGNSALRPLEEMLHDPVSHGILPLFAFFNAGVPLMGVSLSSLAEPVPLGIVFGLFFGKQIGIFSFSWIAVKLRWGKLPDQTSWKMLYAAAVLCGIGFTMSLFISGLAFSTEGGNHATLSRLGILLGSLLSAIVGYLLLASVTRKHPVRP